MSVDLKSIRKLRPVVAVSNETQQDQGTVSWFNRDIQLFDTGLGARKKEAFFLEFGVLLKAGLDFKSALELVTSGMGKKDREKVFTPMQDAVIHGASLSEAMENSGKFTAYDVYSVRIAEESGTMESVLNELAAFYHKSMQHRRLLVSALSYPAIVVFTAIGALSFLLNFLVPMFGDVYKRLNQDLPGITKAVVHLSHLFAVYSGPFFLGIGSLTVLFFIQRKALWFRRGSSWLLLRTPIIGNLVRLLFLNRFCSAMAFLCGAKVPVLEALSLTQKMVGFYPLETALDSIQAAILRGQSLHKSMEQFSLFPKRMTALVKVGEEVNKLDQMFGRLATQYNDEAEHQIKSLGSLIEPVLIVFLAVVVGFVLIAMYLPIFKLVTNFSG